jgi:CTP:molybdopterin cytidylyltransferase MocA
MLAEGDRGARDLISHLSATGSVKLLDQYALDIDRVTDLDKIREHADA